MIDKSQLPLIRLSHTKFKYNSILKLNELISFRIILFLYNLLHKIYISNTFFIYNKIYFINENNEISKHNFF